MANTLTSLTTAVALIAVSGTAALAGGTDAQREACTPDAFRLCTSAMPDEGRVENCLRSAGPRLSAACYAVFYPQSASNQAQINQPQVARGQTSVRERVQPSATARLQAPSMRSAPASDDE